MAHVYYIFTDCNERAFLIDISHTGSLISVHQSP